MLLNVIGELSLTLLVCATGAIKFCSRILSILEIWCEKGIVDLRSLNNVVFPIEHASDIERPDHQQFSPHFRCPDAHAIHLFEGGKKMHR